MKTFKTEIGKTKSKNWLALPLFAIIIVFAITLEKTYAVDSPVDKTKTELSSKLEKYEKIDIMPVVDATQLVNSIKYPEKARKMGLEGKVIVKILVSKEGKVKSAEIVESVDEIFEQPALDAVKDVKFKPGLKDGVAVETWVNLPIEFRLDKK